MWMIWLRDKLIRCRRGASVKTESPISWMLFDAKLRSVNLSQGAKTPLSKRVIELLANLNSWSLGQLLSDPTFNLLSPTLLASTISTFGNDVNKFAGSVSSWEFMNRTVVTLALVREPEWFPEKSKFSLSPVIRAPEYSQVYQKSGKLTSGMNVQPAEDNAMWAVNARRIVSVLTEKIQKIKYRKNSRKFNVITSLPFPWGSNKWRSLWNKTEWKLWRLWGLNTRIFFRQ